MGKLRFADPRPDVKSRSLRLTPIKTYYLGNQKSIGDPFARISI
jgi:hypothetical protein